MVAYLRITSKGVATEIIEALSLQEARDKAVALEEGEELFYDEIVNEKGDKEKSDKILVFSPVWATEEIITRVCNSEFEYIFEYDEKSNEIQDFPVIKGWERLLIWPCFVYYKPLKEVIYESKDL